jgi:signal transduction histidine kinase
MMHLVPRTVTFRIAFLYAILSSTVAGVVFVLVYLSLAADLMHRMDDELLNMVKELRYIHQTAGREGAYTEFKVLRETEGENRMFARVLAADLTVIATSGMSAWASFGIEGNHFQGLVTNVAQFRTITIPSSHHKMRLVNLKTVDGTIYQVGYSLREDDEIMEDFREVFSQAFVLLLVCGGIGGWFLSRRAMRGVARVREAALTIGTGDFDRRVPLGNEGQEIIDLAVAFNEMIERIQLLIKGLKNVTDNIAHDLRSPITRIRGAAETTLTGDQDLADYQEMTGMVVDECDRLVSMINTMLEIAETDAGAVKIPASPVDMRLVLKEAYELFELVAEGKGLYMEIDCPEKPLPVFGERAKLQRAISNLIDNAVKFTPPGGCVRLRAQDTPANVIISISDTGPGLEVKDQERIYERFYRGDQSRSTPGYGLGLSLVKAVIKAHGGEITVQSSPGNGCTFIVHLPHSTDS